MLLFLISRFKIKLNRKDKKLIFLTSITILPIILMFLTSLITGARIRTMGMAPFYLFLGVFFVYIFQSKIYLLKLKNFFMIFLFIFILSPTTYYLTSVKEKNERTDYPGKEISQIVQKRWNNNFSNEIEIVVGYGWIDSLIQNATEQITDVEFQNAEFIYPHNPPSTKEAYLYRKIFEQFYSGRSNTVAKWVPQTNWDNVDADPSGRAQTIHEQHSDW